MFSYLTVKMSVCEFFSLVKYHISKTNFKNGSHSQLNDNFACVSLLSDSPISKQCAENSVYRHKTAKFFEKPPFSGVTVFR